MNCRAFRGPAAARGPGSADGGSFVPKVGIRLIFPYTSKLVCIKEARAYEAYVSAASAQAAQHPRIPPANGDKEWPKSSCPAPRQGPETSLRQRRAPQVTRVRRAGDCASPISFAAFGSSRASSAKGAPSPGRPCACSFVPTQPWAKRSRLGFPFHAASVRPSDETVAAACCARHSACTARSVR